MKTRASTNLYGNTWALDGAHLPFEARRESRSRQENRYGRHAVHVRVWHRSGPAAAKTLLVPVALRTNGATNKDATHPVTACHGNVKTLSILTPAAPCRPAVSKASFGPRGRKVTSSTTGVVSLNA